MTRGSSERHYFGMTVLCWLLSEALSPSDDANKIADAIRQILLKLVRGLVILEEGKYVCWPDVLDPGVDVSKEILSRGQVVGAFANELAEWPPWTGLELVAEDVRRRYEALSKGLQALAELYNLLSMAAPRRILMEPDKSTIAIGASPWRVMVVNPLANSPLGEIFIKLQKSGLVATWLGDPLLSGASADLADL